MVRNVIGGLAAALLVVVGGCGPTYSPDTYASGAVQQANKVEQGEVVGVRKVAVSADATLGTVTGAAAGGIAGSSVDAGGPISALSALGGSVVGGVVGSGVAHATGDTVAFEYIVRQINGDLVSVTQRDAVPLAIGQKVLVITGKQARVVADYTVTLPGSPSRAKEADKAKPAAPSAPAGATLPPASGMTSSAAAVTMAPSTGGLPANGVAPSSGVPPAGPVMPLNATAMQANGSAAPSPSIAAAPAAAAPVAAALAGTPPAAAASPLGYAVGRGGFAGQFPDGGPTRQSGLFGASDDTGEPNRGAG